MSPTEIPISPINYTDYTYSPTALTFFTLASVIFIKLQYKTVRNYYLNLHELKSHDNFVEAGLVIWAKNKTNP